jgi:hypothetical protein
LRVAIESTTLASVAYDETRKLLQLEFCSQAVYIYLGVPAAVHQALLSAPSKGRYFNQAIRGRFPFRLLRSWDTTQVDAEIPAECHR